MKTACSPRRHYLQSHINHIGRQTWVGLLLQYLPYTIQIQPVTSTSLINGYPRILWFYTAKKKNSCLLPQIPSLRSTPFCHPLSCSSSSFIPWLSHYDMRCCGDRWKGRMSAFFCGTECRLIQKLVLCAQYNTVFSDYCLTFVLIFVRLEYSLHTSF